MKLITFLSLLSSLKKTVHRYRTRDNYRRLLHSVVLVCVFKSGVHFTVSLFSFPNEKRTNLVLKFNEILANCHHTLNLILSRRKSLEI